MTGMQVGEGSGDQLRGILLLQGGGSRRPLHREVMQSSQTPLSGAWLAHSPHCTSFFPSVAMQFYPSGRGNNLCLREGKREEGGWSQEDRRNSPGEWKAGGMSVCWHMVGLRRQWRE